MIIVDTSVISEWIKPQPAKAVVSRARFVPWNDLFTTATTEAEMRFGIAIEDEGTRKRENEEIVEDIFSNKFAGRILPFDTAAAKAYSIILSQMQRRGRTFSRSDAQIAAIATVHGATIATRDSGFEHSGVPLIDPWDI